MAMPLTYLKFCNYRNYKLWGLVFCAVEGEEFGRNQVKYFCMCQKQHRQKGMQNISFGCESQGKIPKCRILKGPKAKPKVLPWGIGNKKIPIVFLWERESGGNTGNPLSSRLSRDADQSIPRARCGCRLHLCQVGIQDGVGGRGERWECEMGDPRGR